MRQFQIDAPNCILTLIDGGWLVVDVICVGIIVFRESRMEGQPPPNQSSFAPGMPFIVHPAFLFSSGA
ncbi:MAG: hypothetical protein GY820_21695 [Gammaproteobacteria bacterium]|nr:hypothetical protein [Gammaproteobacteria bacterium]